jgi:serine/threonine protein kinase
VATSSSSETEGSHFGNFEILRDAAGAPLLLGQGTFGRTYQARHRYLETIVALKIISERFVRDTLARDRFLTEAKAAAKLSHPHIARLYDFGEKENVLFYAMEFCAGGDLGDFVKKQGALSPAQLLDVAKQLGEALQCAHVAGLIHRDIKPSNVMLAGSDTALATKLIDFGLVHVHGSAKAEGDADTHMLGTPLFASPEQLREEPVDARTDLFSLGMTLWFLAIGQAPESGSLADITAGRLNPESYAGRLPDHLPEPLKSGIARLVEKDSSKRFSTAGEFLHSLGHETRAPVVPSPQPAKTEELQVEPLGIETVNATLSTEWKTGSRQSETFTGIKYPGESTRDAKGKAWLHVLNAALLTDVDALWRLRNNAARFSALRLPGLFSPLGVRAYTDFTAVILEKPECTPLLNSVPGQAAAAIVALQPVLEKIADTCDAIAAAHLPGANLQASDIWLQAPASDLSSAQPKLFPRFLSSREAPNLSKTAGSQDVGSTVTSEMFTSAEHADDMRAQFGRLIYRIAAGRNCPAAASLASQAYVAVPNLSEQANRTLALVIARKREYPTCRALLQDLRRSEGSSTMTSSYASSPRAGSVAASPAASPPPLPTPFAAKPDATRTIMGRPSAPEPPPVTFREPVARAKPKPSGKRSPLILVGAVLVALVLILAAYKILHRPTSAPVVEKPSEAESFAAGTKLRLTSGGVPKHATFSLAGKKLEPERDGSDILLPLGGVARHFPLELDVEAKGFKRTSVTVKDEADVTAGHPVSMFRNTGRIMFVGPASDYTHATVSMKALLPDEQGLDEIRVERADRGTEIRPGGRNSIEVATGVYSVNLRGDNSRTVRPLFIEKKYEVKSDEPVTINIPPSFVGSYKGAVKLADKRFDLQITIESGLANGQLTEQGGSSRTATWTDGIVGADGMYRAQAHFDDGDVALALRIVDENKIALAPDSASAGRDGKSAQPYAATGELERSGENP